MRDHGTPKRLIEPADAEKSAGALVPSAQPHLASPALQLFVQDVRDCAENVGRRMRLDPDVVDDVAQNVAIRASRSPAALASYMSGAGAIIKTVRAALRNAAIDDQRALATRERVLQDMARDVAQTYASPADLHDATELASFLNAAIQALPTQFRLAVVMSIEEGKTDTEIAAALGVSPQAAKGYVLRAKRRLREQLTQAGYNVPAPRALGRPKDGVLHFPSARAANDNSQGGGNRR
jgi:RNA polymerase sigma factor (sigma-70 family)